jgi:prepilin-type N-terminal cleavage/methylation domain-containing protein
MRRRGFTLVEMAVVVSLMTILTAIAFSTTRGWVFGERKNSAEVEWARAADSAFGWLLKDLREAVLPLPEQQQPGLTMDTAQGRVWWRAVSGRLFRDDVRMASGVAEMNISWDGSVATVTLVFEAPTGEPPHRRAFTRTAEVRTGGMP